MSEALAIAPTRHVLRWHGGKWLLAQWVMQFLPTSARVYIEPFGGGASVLLQRPRAFAEIINDLDGELVNLFRILRDPTLSHELLHLLRLTPFSRAEFAVAYESSDEPVERARRLLIRSWMGQGSVSNLAIAGATGFRNNTCRSTQSPFSPIPAHDWSRYPTVLREIIARLDGVVIESRPAIDLMRQQDRADVLFYCDPPYLPETRSRLGNRKGDGFIAYQHDMTAYDHAALLAFLQTLTGMVVLSGYPSKLYDDALSDWRRVETQALADGARKRTEVLWINPAAAQALDRVKGGHDSPLFRERTEAVG